MTYERHIRVSCTGVMPGAEIFSFGFALDNGEAWGDLHEVLTPTNAVWDDMRDDIVTYWNLSPVSAACTLKAVKFAFIDTDGTYMALPIEREVGINGAGIAGGNVDQAFMPNQVSLAVTLNTAGLLGKVKGRFYLPLPTGAPRQADGRIAESTRDAHETQAAAFLTNINNQPGLDVVDLRVVVASQGRRKNIGTKDNPVWQQVAPPANYPVTGVTVGRTLDTIRRRRNKLSEFHGTPTSVS